METENTVFSAPETPAPPMAVVLDYGWESAVISTGAAEVVVVHDYIELWDDQEYEDAKTQLATVEKILPFISNEEERALLDGAADDLRAAIRDYEESLDAEPVDR